MREPRAIKPNIYKAIRIIVTISNDGMDDRLYNEQAINPDDANYPICSRIRVPL